MSKKVRLAAVLPADDEVQGLDATVADLLDAPKKLRTALITYRVRGVYEDVATGNQIPTVEIQQLEPMGLLADLDPGLRKQVLDLREQRTGKTPLPLELASVDEGDDEAGDDDR